MACRLLICHDEGGRSVASELYFKFRERGVVAWLPSGNPASRTAEQAPFEIAVSEAQVMLVLLSQGTGDSAQMEEAARHGKTIFALSLDGAAVDPALSPKFERVWTRDAAGTARETYAVIRDELLRVIYGAQDRHKDQRLAQIVGFRGDRFVTQWSKASASPFMWSWEAFAGGPIWLFLRGLSEFGLTASLMLAMIVLAAKRFGSGAAAAGAFAAGWVFLAVVIGATGSILLRRHALRRMEDNFRVPSDALIGQTVIAVFAVTAAFLVPTRQPFVQELAAPVAPASPIIRVAAAPLPQVRRAPVVAAEPVKAPEPVRDLRCHGNNTGGSALFSNCEEENLWLAESPSSTSDQVVSN